MKGFQRYPVSAIAAALLAAGVLGACSSITDSVVGGYDSVTGYIGDVFSSSQDAPEPADEPSGETEPPRKLTNLSEDGRAGPTKSTIPVDYRPPTIRENTPMRIVLEALDTVLRVDGPTRDADAVRVIASAPHRTHPELTRYLEANAASLPPLVLYELSARIYPRDQWRGVQWYFTAYTRYAYDLFRCSDPSVMKRIEKADALVLGPLTKIRLNPKTAYGAALAGLTWDRDHPIHETSPLIECLSGDKFLQTLDPAKSKIRRAADGRVILQPFDLNLINADEWIKPLPEHERLLAAARVKSRARLESLLTLEVKLPKEWDD